MNISDTGNSSEFKQLEDSKFNLLLVVFLPILSSIIYIYYQISNKLPEQCWNNFSPFETFSAMHVKEINFFS